jgi:hypothetical protein
MGVKVEKRVFEQLIKKFVNEHNNSRSKHNSRIDQNAGEDAPILPNDHMPVQLSREMPNVADDEYLPTTVSSLTDAAAAIAQEVPQDQIEFFYNQLHSLLKRVMDREEETRLPMMEALLFEALDEMLKEDERDDLNAENSNEESDELEMSADEEDAVTISAENPEQEKEYYYDKSSASEIVTALAKLLVDRKWNMAGMLNDDGESYAMKHDKSNQQYLAKIASNDSDREYVDNDNIASVPAESNSVISARIGPQQIKEMLLYAFINDNDVKRLILDFYKLTKPKKVAKVMSTGFNAYKLGQRDLSELAVIFLDLSELLLKEPGFNDPMQGAEEAASRKSDAALGILHRSGEKAAMQFKKEVDEENKALSKFERGEKLIDALAIEIENPTDAEGMPKEAIEAYTNQLQKYADDLTPSGEAETAETDPIWQYKNALRQISGQNKDKTGIYNADKLAPFFSLKGAAAMRQGLSTNSALKAQFQNLHKMYITMPDYDEAQDYYGQFVEQMNSGFNDFAMSDHIKTWIDKTRKSPPAKLHNPTQFFDKLEEIYTSVESGAADVSSFETKDKYSSQLNLLKFAFENATNKKMMTKYRKDLVLLGANVVEDNIDGVDSKVAKIIGDRIMGNKRAPTFEPANSPMRLKPFADDASNDMFALGIDKKKFFDLQVQTFSSLGTYLKQNINDIFNKIFDDSENKSKVLTSLDKAIEFTARDYKEDHAQTIHQLALIGIINDEKEDTGIFDLSDDMDSNIEKSKKLNRIGDDGVDPGAAKDSDFGINERTVMQIKQITEAFKSGKISQAKYKKARKIISRLG